MYEEVLSLCRNLKLSRIPYSEWRAMCLLVIYMIEVLGDLTVHVGRQKCSSIMPAPVFFFDTRRTQRVRRSLAQDETVTRGGN